MNGQLTEQIASSPLVLVSDCANSNDDFHGISTKT